jgi:hypothetical protein
MDGHNQKLVPDQIMQSLFPQDNDLEEEPMIVSKCKKISNWGIGSDRVIILSTHYIYLLSSREIKKKVSISEVKYFIKSTIAACKEILLFFREGYDIRLSFDESEQFLNLLKLRYASLSPKTTLKVYGVPNSTLKDYVAPANKTRAYIDVAPEEQYRLLNEEIPGSLDKDRQSELQRPKTKSVAAA